MCSSVNNSNFNNVNFSSSTPTSSTDEKARKSVETSPNLENDGIASVGASSVSEVSKGIKEVKDHSPRSSFPTLSESTSSVASSEAISAMKGSAVNSSGRIKLLSVLKDYASLGIASKDRIDAENKKKGTSFKAIYSVDKHSGFSSRDSVCLNYIHNVQGIQTSLTNLAKGGLSVVLEREQDKDILNGTSLDDKALKELSERAHQSFLFIMPVDRTGENDAQLSLTNAMEQDVSSKKVFISPNTFGCMETRALGTISPKQFSHIIVSDRMKSLIEKDETLSQFNVVYVSSEKTTLKYKGKEVTIDCPDYEQVLAEIFEEREEEIDKNFPDEFAENRPVPEFFTHMARCATEKEISQGVFD